MSTRYTDNGEEIAVPVHPGYIFRVGIVHHPDAGPQANSEKAVYLELPATPEQFQTAEDALGALGWLGTVFASIEGIIPGVDKLLYTTEDLPELNCLAEKLADMAPKDLLSYKVLLGTADCHDLRDALLLADGMCTSASENSPVAKVGNIFHVYASLGRYNYTELDLPASDYEMLDLAERLRLEPGQPPYVEVLRIHEQYDYLDKCLPGLPDIYQLNALARKLAGFTSVLDMAAFEGMVGVEVQKGSVPIEIPKLINFAHSTEYCHVAADATTDHQLGKFLVENDFIADAVDLPDATLELLDYGKIGREHREQTNGVYTGFGYVEVYGDVRHVSETMDFRPRKPAYTMLVNMAAMPLAGGRLRKEDMLQLRLPAPEAQMQEVLEKLGKQDWKDVAASIVDSPIPRLNHTMYFDGEAPQILELSQRLSELDAQGQMTKYKAILAANDCGDITRAISLAGEVDAHFFEPKVSSPEDVARDELKVVICDKDAETLVPHIDLTGYGLALLERDQAVITKYGLVERESREQTQTMEDQPGPGGMEMM